MSLHAATKPSWVPPDGCLCDAARPGWFVAKQGDGRVDIHDWGMEFTAAGMVMQAELLLISRDAKAIEHYLPKLRRSRQFHRNPPRSEEQPLPGRAGGQSAGPQLRRLEETRRNLRQGLSGRPCRSPTSPRLDRLIELEKLAGNAENVKLYSERRESGPQGLAAA